MSFSVLRIHAIQASQRDRIPNGNHHGAVFVRIESSKMRKVLRKKLPNRKKAIEHNQREGTVKIVY
jgi:hypothetical protein